jgi:ubiquitin carboxyl-terminal hydrolase 22/27/51
MDLTYGVVYCFSCQDYIHDNQFEAIAKKQSYKAAKMVGVRNTQYYPWQPSITELEVLKNNPQRKRISENSHIGMHFILIF